MFQTLEGVTIDHYRVIRRLARGGMAEIYLAEDTQTGVSVAIKVVHNDNENYYIRFRREVLTTADLSHEHILPALDWGEYEQWYYMVMPYLQYGTLNDRLAKGPLSAEETEKFLTQLTSALQYAHERGIVHRDIKPSNVLMRDERSIYLADFGLIKAAGTDHSLTQSGYLIGTPEYIAPELLDGPATVRSDIYALGILLYQMTTGRVPFKGETPISIIWKHVQEEPEPPSRLNPAISPAVEQVILQALAKDPKQRFQSVSALQQAYQHALTKQDELQQTASSTLIKRLPALDAQHIPTLVGEIVDTARPFIIRPRPAAFVIISAVFLLLMLVFSSVIFSPPSAKTAQASNRVWQNVGKATNQTLSPSPTTTATGNDGSQQQHQLNSSQLTNNQSSSQSNNQNDQRGNSNNSNGNKDDNHSSSSNNASSHQSNGHDNGNGPGNGGNSQKGRGNNGHGSGNSGRSQKGKGNNGNGPGNGGNSQKGQGNNENSQGDNENGN